VPRTTREMSWNYQGISHCLRVVTLTVSVCLQILNSFNISGMDEATLFKFDKWVGYDGVHPGVKNLPQKGRGLGHVTLVIIKNPFNISGMDEATLFKVGKFTSTPRMVKKSPERGVVLVT